MLYNEEAVKANIRNRDGKRVFFLGGKDTLTPSARDWLCQQRIEIRPATEAPISQFQLYDGGITDTKQEQMTHLRGNILVPKTHPIIAFRGAMDTLQAELLLAQSVADEKIRCLIDEILALARNIIRWEVMEEAAVMDDLCGLTPQELRSHSHRPQDFYGQPHFMPSFTDGACILQLNRARCAARSAELAAARAFEAPTGECTRLDILTILNRMSSMLYILMIRQKAAQNKGGHHGTHTDRSLDQCDR